MFFLVIIGSDRAVGCVSDAVSDSAEIQRTGLKSIRKTMITGKVKK